MLCITSTYMDEYCIHVLGLPHAILFVHDAVVCRECMIWDSGNHGDIIRSFRL